MTELKGGRGVPRSPDARRTSGKRLTAISPAFYQLFNVIATRRGWSKAHTIEMAALALATAEEAAAVGLVKPETIEEADAAGLVE